MPNFKFGSHNDGNGKIVYNVGIVNGIVALAIKEVEGAMLVSGKKRGISLFFEKDGVYADVSVIVKYGVSIRAVVEALKESVKYKVERFTGMIVNNINVKVMGVKE